MLKPIQVKAIENYQLYLKFNNGEERILDVRPYLQMPYYYSLKDIKEFKKVFISEYGIQWSNGKDISPHELYDYSIPLK